MTRTLSREGVEHLKRLEGYRAAPYIDGAGVATIGYGFTWYPDTGKKVTMQDTPLTPSRAEEVLRAVLLRYEAAVNSQVVQPLEQRQFDALVSFAYNVGVYAFSRSTLLKVINRDPCDYPAIEYQLKRWRRAGGKVNKGLIYRRIQEFKLYTNGQTD